LRKLAYSPLDRRSGPCGDGPARLVSSNLSWVPCAGGPR